jgi:ribosome-binding protein aMBF1 (putative translation factor)
VLKNAISAHGKGLSNVEKGQRAMAEYAANLQLVTYMRSHNLSQEWLATKIGKSQSTTSRYLAGKIVPDVRTANKIALATGGAISPSDWGTEDVS